jgi:hypothetical protein
MLNQVLLRVGPTSAAVEGSIGLRSVLQAVERACAAWHSMMPTLVTEPNIVQQPQAAANADSLASLACQAFAGTSCKLRGQVKDSTV